jgi:microcompartment protein CcmL/EutN
MNRYPAIALIENASIASGIRCADIMAKQAPVSVMKSGTVHDGKYLILIGGSVASVEESYSAALAQGKDYITDSVILPDVHEQVHDAVLGSRLPCIEESLGIIETHTVATLLCCVDAGIKGANVTLVEMRLADDLGGKAFALLNGHVEEVEAAISIARRSVKHDNLWMSEFIIPYLNDDIAQQLSVTSFFATADLQKMAGGEI